MAAAVVAFLEAHRSAGAAIPWPHERFDLTHTRLVSLVERFEECREQLDGDDAMFSYLRPEHGQRLERILDRFDRFQRGAPYPTFCGRLGVGHWRASVLLLSWREALLRPDARGARARRVRSLAYFLPQLDRESKEWRRRARALDREENDGR